MSHRTFPGLALCLAWTAAGCGPNMAAVRRGVAESPYRRVAVIAFTDAPGAPGSGRAASDLFSIQLQKAGYQLVGRDAEPDLLLSGAVTDDYVEQATRPAFYGDDWAAGDLYARPWDYPEGWMPPPAGYAEELVNTAVFSVSARLTRVDSGTPVWIGYGTSKQTGGTLQQAAAAAVDEAAGKLFRALAKRKKR